MTRHEAIKQVFGVSDSEATKMMLKTPTNRTPIQKVCKELEVKTEVKASLWKQHSFKELSVTMVKAVECAKMKRELERVKTLFWTLYGSSSIMMSLSDEDGDYIEHFLNREEKQ